jgi:hypothetical protein
MELTDLQIKLLWAIGGFLGGSLLSLCAAYVATIRDVAFIKGQLQNLLKLGDILADTNRSIVIMDRNQITMKKDLDAAHSAIRDLKKVSNQ